MRTSTAAHIASLLMTFFFRQMPALIDQGHLYLAVPPLYKLAQGPKVAYARDEKHREELMRTVMNGRAKVEVSRFKGLGEMLPAQLKETTMDPKKRHLLRVTSKTPCAPPRHAPSSNSWATSPRSGSISSASGRNS